MSAVGAGSSLKQQDALRASCPTPYPPTLHMQGDLAVMQSQVLQLTQAQARTSNDPQASMNAAADLCGDLTTPQVCSKHPHMA